MALTPRLRLCDVAIAIMLGGFTANLAYAAGNEVARTGVPHERVSWPARNGFNFRGLQYGSCQTSTLITQSRTALSSKNCPQHYRK